MNKEEKKQMKSIIKPLIKECLHEIMLQEGLIRMLKEHNLNESSQQTQNSIQKRPMPETKSVIKSLQKESVEEKKQAIQEVKKAASFSGFDPFAGTEDIDLRIY